MTFTYDLSASGNDLVVSQIRLEIGDDNSATDQGVKPDGTNFTDAELLYFYQQESSSLLGGAARACEVLARRYARVAESVRIRDYQVDMREKAAAFRELARDLRQRAGSLYAGGSAPTTRTDGYSTDVHSQEVEAGGGSENWQDTKVTRWP